MNPQQQKTLLLQQEPNKVFVELINKKELATIIESDEKANVFELENKDYNYLVSSPLEKH